MDNSQNETARPTLNEAGESNETSRSKPPKPRSRMRWIRLLVLAVAITGAIGIGWPWLKTRWSRVHLDDARVAASVVTVASEVSGRVTGVSVVAGDRVAKGTILVQIDTEQSALQRDAIAAKLSAADAQIAQIRTQQEMVRQQIKSRKAAAEAGITAAKANREAATAVLLNAQKRYDRARALSEKNVTSAQSLDEATAGLDTARQQERAAEAAIETAEANLAVISADAAQVDVIERQIATLVAERTAIQAEKSQRDLDLSHRVVEARFDGVVDATFVDAGEYVTPGTRLLMYHSPNDIWIDANVKETDFSKVKLGAAVAVTVDAFPGKQLTGRVVRLGGAATSQLALLPSPNPSGNFTKVTQRIPIRVEVDPSDVSLRPGMMVELYVHVEN